MIGTLLDATEGVWEGATRECAAKSNTSTQALQERAVYTMSNLLRR